MVNYGLCKYWVNSQTIMQNQETLQQCSLTIKQVISRLTPSLNLMFAVIFGEQLTYKKEYVHTVNDRSSINHVHTFLHVV